ncbi:MAG: succinate dehydrogenase, cytochrome b556 subunit [Pseudomonadota bacterium]
MTTAVKQRPKHLNLLKIKQPIPAIVSILHRASGAGLFLFFIPLALCALQGSLGSPEGFAQLANVFANPIAKLLLIGFIWAYIHHFCAGIRFLLLDLNKGITLGAARMSAKIVLVVSLLLTFIIAAKIW